MKIEHRPGMVHRTKAELIMHELRDLIFSGQLAPGQRLILREIAQGFGCSGIPVREALNSLASLGLVTIAPHEGARVSQFDLRELLELTEIRLVLELSATLNAAQRFDKPTLKVLRDIVAKMEEAVSARDAVAYSELNRQFHDKIFERCANTKMVTTIRGLREQTQRGRAVHSVVPTHNRQSLLIHKRIVRTIASGDLAKLEAVMKEHNDNALHSMERLAIEKKENEVETA